VRSPHHRNRKPRFRPERTGAVLIVLVVVALLALWSLRPSRLTPRATFPPPTETPTPPQLPLPEPTIPPATPASTPDTELAEGCPEGCVAQKPGCDIKGNISKKKEEKIYHLPGQSYYDKTIISPEDGERWFCTEAEAQAAGWRKAKV
jgi:hypothetical protein